MRWVHGGGSYLSQSDTRVHFGVPGGAAIERITVHWPSGTTQTLKSVTSDQVLKVVEPQKDSGDGK